MSYAIKTDTDPELVVFYETEESLLNEVTQKTLYRGLSIKTEGGESLIDEYALTPDETDVFRTLMQEAYTEVFGLVMKMTWGADDASGTDLLKFNTNVILEGSSVEYAYGFSIVNHEAYNDNHLVLVERAIRKCVIDHTIANWYKLKGLDAEAQKFLADYEYNKRLLVNKYLFGLRKPLFNAS